MRVELKALLEADDGTLRMTALKTMEKNAVRLAGPSLVLRIKAASSTRSPSTSGGKR